MSHTGRFKMIKVPGGWHVGVLDTKRKRILELVADESKKRAIIQEIFSKKFNSGKYDIIQPRHSVDDDETIEERWNDLLEFYEDLKDKGKDLEYHPGGEFHRKGRWNCEVLAELVMTGEPVAPQGNKAAWLHNNLGINVATRESGVPEHIDPNSRYSSWYSGDDV